jgi:hypothetical protein
VKGEGTPAGAYPYTENCDSDEHDLRLFRSGLLSKISEIPCNWNHGMTIQILGSGQIRSTTVHVRYKVGRNGTGMAAHLFSDIYS